MSIPQLQPAVRQYLIKFDLAAVALTRDGRLISTTNPAGCDRAWWCRSLDVGRVLRVARAVSGDVLKAAASLGVKCIEHAAAVQHAARCIATLDNRLEEAQRAGNLGFINQQYRARRLIRCRATASMPTRRAL